MGCGSSSGATVVVQPAGAPGASSSDGSEAEARLKRIFDGIGADGDGTVSVAELTVALKKADLDLAALLEAACMNSSLYVLDRLEADQSGRTSWDDFRSSLRLVIGIKSGDMVVDASTRAKGLVINRTATEVELLMPDGSKVSRDIEDIRMAPVSEAEASLRKVFDGIDADKNGTVSKEELTAALKADTFDLSRVLTAAGIDNHSNVMEKLDANKDGKITWSEFKSGLFLAREFKLGDVAVVSSTGSKGRVVNLTATEVQLETTDGSKLWQDIADLDVGTFRKG